MILQHSDSDSQTLRGAKIRITVKKVLKQEDDNAHIDSVEESSVVDEVANARPHRRGSRRRPARPLSRYVIRTWSVVEIKQKHERW